MYNLCIVCSWVNACMTCSWSRGIIVFVNIEAAGLWDLWTSCLTASWSRTPRRTIEIIRCWYYRINSTTAKLWKAGINMNYMLLHVLVPKISPTERTVRSTQNDTIQFTVKKQVIPSIRYGIAACSPVI